LRVVKRSFVQHQGVIVGQVVTPRAVDSNLIEGHNIIWRLIYVLRKGVKENSTNNTGESVFPVKRFPILWDS
jgi:hypothetical protein